MQTIILRIALDRPPTQEDRMNQLGLDEMQKKLFDAGWVDSNGIVLKQFHVAFEGHDEEGNHYIEWKATLKE